MIVFPNAKINIGLRIISKRDDGFHNIETIFYPVKIYDALEFIVSPVQESDELVTTGNNQGLGNPGDNLVIKALNKLREKRNFPFLQLHLHKAIPSGAGLGGGSSDASFILKAVNRYFSLDIPESELKSIAATIGSDCPFFIDNIPSIAQGRGEILNPVSIDLGSCYMILLNPGLHVSTKEAYENCKPAVQADSLAELVSSPVSGWRDNIKNDFEDYVFTKHPLIRQLKDELYNMNADFSLMSGSGSSVFGLFSSKPEVPEKLRRYLIYEGNL